MKTDFQPQEFIDLLESTQKILEILVKSRQYHNLTNSRFYSSPNFTLDDAVRSLEECADAFKEMEVDSMIAQGG